jgi:acyl-CoA dehydrogenase
MSLRGSGLFERDMFDDSHAALRADVAAFLDARIVPAHPGWTEARDVPREVWEQAGATGLLGRTVPEEYGGRGRDFRDAVVIIEELAARRLSGLPTFLQSAIMMPFLVRLGTDDQKNRYLPGLCEGRLIGAVALTEPQSGSDIYAMRTTIARNGDNILLDGSKSHISNGSKADLILVAGRSEKGAVGGQPGFSLVLVEANTPGITRDPIRKAGMQALDTARLSFDGCRIPAANLLGPEGMGFMYLMRSLVVERLVLAIYAQASTEVILRETIAACEGRRTSSGTVLDYQNTHFRLADLYGECAANRTFVDHCIQRHLRERMDPRAACIAKLRTTELLRAVAGFALQMRGAAGISDAEGARTIQDLVDSSVQTIWGGSSEVMRDVIGRSMANVL